MSAVEPSVAHRDQEEEEEDRFTTVRHKHMLLAMDRYMKHKRKQRIRQKHWKEGRLLRSCAVQRKEVSTEWEVGWEEEEEEEEEEEGNYGSSPSSTISTISTYSRDNTQAKKPCGVDVGVVSAEYLELAERMERVQQSGMASCDAVRNCVDETEGWTKVNIKHMKAFRKDVVGCAMIGKGQVDLGDVFTPKEILSYLWQTEIAEEYDEMLAKACGLESLPNGMEILYQAFKSRYAQRGRDIVFYTAHKWSSADRVSIGCKSIKDYPQTEVMLEGCVRAFNHIAGYDIHRHADGNVVLSFVFQADIYAEAVPTWIINRVKLDQLHVVKSIRTHLHIRYKKEVEERRAAKQQESR
eukprot:GHVS01091833.1.p2 GENE.GHVS01091833.1~~GHVS01091833.1.p2  ORF type:complete len:353 (-),score=68.72 GHVS01091833.1:2048-3106(-)